MAEVTFAAVTSVGLPISSGGAHSLGRMSRRTAYERTRSFLEACTEPVRHLEASSPSTMSRTLRPTFGFDGN